MTRNIKYPEEVRTDFIQRAVDLGRRRRRMPYPECTDLCPVSHSWGEAECRVICWHKFGEKKRPQA